MIGNTRLLFLLLSCTVLGLTSCQKENANEENNGNCNNTVLKLKKIQATFEPQNFLEAEWNNDGTIHAIRMNTMFSQMRNATYIYQGDRIREAVIRNNNDNSLVDTAVFRYNAQGLVDSMYLKHDNYFDIALSYLNGKLVRYTRYGSDRKVMFYLDVEMDDRGNVVSGIEWWNEAGTFEKQSTHKWTRDTRKNPLKDLAPYMLYLDDAYNIFWHWGPNNYIDQEYTDHTGTGAYMVTGQNFKYDNNCYPLSYRSTIGGHVIFEDDDFLFTYY